MSEYSGEERRNRPVRSSDDHDMLVKLDTNMTNIGKNLDDFMSQFDDHTKEDKENFDVIHERINKVSQYVFIGVGIVATLEVVGYLILKK